MNRAVTRSSRKSVSFTSGYSSAMTERSPLNQVMRRILFLGLAGAVTLTLQQWIGDATIYLPVNRARAEVLHRAILENRPPAGLTWNDLGANGTNIRVGAVYVAEALHRATGLTVARSYLALDTLCLLVALLLFGRFLATWFRDEYMLLGTLYFMSTLPLTYFLVSYHPWDRLALVFWLLALLALRAERMLLFALLLPLSVAVKYDSVLLPGLYFLANIRPSTWRRTTVITAALFLVSFGTFFILLAVRPGGFASHGIAQQIAANLSDMREMLLWYPPLLAFGVPVVLAAIGFKHADRFMQASAVCGALLLVPLFLQAFFAEFRAQVPMLVLLMPCALRGVEILLAPASAPLEQSGPL